MTGGCSGPAQRPLGDPLPSTQDVVPAFRARGWDAWGRGQCPRVPSVPHGATVTRASPCAQVQIYEVEEHKIESWRGKKREAVGVAGLGMLHRAWRWAPGVRGCMRGLGGPRSHLSPLAEVYLQGSFKPLVYISPSNR